MCRGNIAVVIQKYNNQDVLYALFLFSPNRA